MNELLGLEVDVAALWPRPVLLEVFENSVHPGLIQSSLRTDIAVSGTPGLHAKSQVANIVGTNNLGEVCNSIFGHTQLPVSVICDGADKFGNVIVCQLFCVFEIYRSQVEISVEVGECLALELSRAAKRVLLE
ncbi:hypothetical protein RZV17_00700 [Xanthomonas cannabis]|uniref:hypothetical protein n=1 Tax=Xanthomonas cannabis TaxID=1885674 RepID=UPI0033A5AC69